MNTEERIDKEEMVDNNLNALKKGRKADTTRIAIIDEDERRRYLSIIQEDYQYSDKED